VKTTDDLIP